MREFDGPCLCAIMDGTAKPYQRGGPNGVPLWLRPFDRRAARFEKGIDELADSVALAYTIIVSKYYPSTDSDPQYHTPGRPVTVWMPSNRGEWGQIDPATMARVV